MTPEEFITSAQADPKGFVLALLREPERIEKLARLKLDEPVAWEWLVAEVRAAGVDNLMGLKKAVGEAAKLLISHTPPPTMEDDLAEYRAQTNGQAASIDLAAVLDDILTLLRRYMWFPLEEQGWACCLWIAHTYCLPATNTSPRLHVKAPDPECGKTRLLELLVELVYNGKHYVKPSPAVLYRLLAKKTYTFLLDEIDGIYGVQAKGDEDLRMIIDAGQRRGGTVPRCVGDGTNMDVFDFPVFSPMGLAGIGRLPRTIESRSIPIALERKTDAEHIESLYLDDIADECEMLRMRLGAWAGDRIDHLRGRRPTPLPALGDRSNEGWFPLRAIANAAGEPWAARAVQAAVVLSKRRDQKDRGINSADLLRDVRDIFNEHPTDDEFLLTQFLLDELHKMEEAPWGVMAKGAGLSSHRLAGILREYGIESKPKKVDGKTRRGYERAQFEPVWGRYLTEGVE